MSNPADRELTKRENYTILDSATETISGAAEAVKESLVGAKEAIFGKAEEIRQANEGENLPQVWSKADEAACNIQADNLIVEAKTLQSSACRQIGKGEEELRQAERAQAAAAVVAARANLMTEQALANEIQGQEKLVAAGNKLMQAGAELQEQAAGMGNHQADINIHATSQINQATAVKTAPVQPAEFHVLQSRVGAECRPIVEHQLASEFIGTQRPPQVG
jgi:hypothetical protein